MTGCTGDGEISLDELREFMRKETPSIMEEQVVERFNEMDINKDGSISKEEFLLSMNLAPQRSFFTRLLDRTNAKTYALARFFNEFAWAHPLTSTLLKFVTQ